MSLTTYDLQQINGIVTNVVTGVAAGLATKESVSGLATEVSQLSLATKESIAGLATKESIAGLATKDDLMVVKLELKDDIKRISEMFDEDYRAEVDRVTRISRRLDKTRKQLKLHVADKSLHQA